MMAQDQLMQDLVQYLVHQENGNILFYHAVSYATITQNSFPDE